MIDWKPIETAPTKLNHRVLVYAGGEIVVGYRNSFYVGAPWFQCEDDGPLNWGVIEPTHWAPLTPPQ